MDRIVRLILTLLALLAGLGAAPVQARIASADPAEVERVDGVAGIGLVAVATAEIRGRSGTERRESCAPKPRPRVTTIVLIPTIQFGDCARE